MKKRIGIFVGVEHFRHKSDELKREGLIRLTSVLINALSSNKDIKPVIICSKISKDVLKDTFSDIGSEVLEFLTTNQTPPAFRLINYLTKPKKDQKQSRWKKLNVYFSSVFNRILINIFSSMLSLILFVVLLLILSILLVKLTFLFPVVAFYSLSALLVVFVFSVFIKKTQRELKRLFIGVKQKARQKFSFRTISFNLYNNVRNNHVSDLVKIVNASDLDFVFVPVAFYPEVVHITKPKVITVPDLIVCDYPQYFVNQIGNNWSAAIERMKNLISNNKYFISYSDYVANKHIYPFAPKDSLVKVIPHGNLSIIDELSREHGASIKGYSLAIMHNYMQKKPNLYINKFNFSNVKYLVYTSQNRPHKNITNLLKAYNILLKQRFCNVKLVLTGLFDHTPSVDKYIKDNNLQYDVLSLPNLSNKELAALDHLAYLAVNPTLFEGGFPFTFNEAYSVGTPSVMSKIPVVDEVVTDSELREKMLFDPYNVDDMVEKLYWAINHRDELFELQKPLYDRLAARSWEVAANEYISYFNEIMQAEING